MDALSRARLSLDGLSVGDALGERFFGHEPTEAAARVAARVLPPAPWSYTDDTEMALSIVAVLAAHRGIDQDALAAAFARRYDPHRGYGGGAHALLAQLRFGLPWRVAAAGLFDGRGSYGNGAAMRVAPVGAYFADDVDRAAEEAALSAAVTHAHPEGAAGAIAVAVAAALAWRQARAGALDGPTLLAEVHARTPVGATRDGLRAALDLPAATTAVAAAARLGAGERVAAFDTVPFALWCAARHLGDYAAAFWETVAGLGDRDTTCAISGGVVALTAPIPPDWLAAREALPPL